MYIIETNWTVYASLYLSYCGNIMLWSGMDNDYLVHVEYADLMQEEREDAVW